MRAGTIVASNYVEMAKLLGTSFLDQHADSTFAILVIDDRPVGAVPDGIEILRLGDLDLGDAEIDLMKTIYDVMELSTAVKPSFLRVLLRDDDIACYLDPDIYVYAPFDDVVAAARTAGIVLTPHVLEPIPRDGCDPTERVIMTSGIFNLGFVAVGRPAARFLDWWQARLVYDAVVDIERGLFTDQRWVDWVPALFEFERCDDRGMNIAWWNIHERDVAVSDSDPDHPTVDGVPVRFVHFSGYDPDLPDSFSKHQQPRPRTLHGPDTAIRALAERYGERLRRQNHLERRAEPYRWVATEDGLPLHRLLRRLVRSAALEEHHAGTEPAAMKTPFAFGPTAGEFRAWLEAPDGGTADHPVSRAERELWSKRPDLRSAFPNIDGEDAPRYRQWLRTEPDVGDVLHDLEPALPAEPPAGPEPAPGEWLRRSYLRARRAAGRAKRAVEARRAG